MSQNDEQETGSAHQGPSFEPAAGEGEQQTPSSSGYSYGAGGYEPRDDGYEPKRSSDGPQNAGYQSQQGGYGSQNAGYQVPQGGYGSQDGGYQSQQGGYGSQDGGYQVPQGGYGSQDGGYQSQQGGYGSPEGGYQSQQGGYGTQQSGFQPSPGGYQPQTYSQPYGAYQPVAPIYGGYGNYGPRKSKSTAALLAFFLGPLGIHDFYLGKKNLGLIHLGLLLGGFMLIVIFAIAAGASGDDNSPLFAGIVPGYLMILANGLWAFVEFIIILAKPEEELGT